MSFVHSQSLGLSSGPPKVGMARAPVPLGVESMFEKIMDVVSKSVRLTPSFLFLTRWLIDALPVIFQASEITELRQQCAELRMANSNLERLVKESAMVSAC